MTDIDSDSQLPSKLESDSIAELRKEIKLLREHIEDRDRNSISWAHLQQGIRTAVADGIERHVNADAKIRPEVHVQVVTRTSHGLAVVLRRLRMALYGLAGLGITSIVGGSFIAALTGPTITVGLLAFVIAGLTGVILELCEKMQ